MSAQADEPAVGSMLDAMIAVSARKDRLAYAAVFMRGQVSIDDLRANTWATPEAEKAAVEGVRESVRSALRLADILIEEADKT